MSVPDQDAATHLSGPASGRGHGMIACYLRDGDRVFETYWATGRATEAMGSVYGLLDMTVYGRQETFEDSPPGWPQSWRNTGEQWRHQRAPHFAMGAARAAPHDLGVSASWCARQLPRSRGS